jgi:hypothetical protein
MVAINSSLTTALIGLLSAVLGTIIGYYFNQHLNLRNLRKDIIFKKKLEYFERLAEVIEINIRMYKNALIAIKTKTSKKESKKKIEEIIEDMKENRKNFKIMASPLYFNVNGLSKMIIDFVNTEKDIFNKFEEFETSAPKTRDLSYIEEKINILKNHANKMLIEMRDEIKK